MISSNSNQWENSKSVFVLIVPLIYIWNHRCNLLAFSSVHPNDLMITLDFTFNSSSPMLYTNTVGAEFHSILNTILQSQFLHTSRLMGLKCICASSIRLRRPLWNWIALLQTSHRSHLSWRSGKLMLCRIQLRSIESCCDGPLLRHLRCKHLRDKQAYELKIRL